MEMDGVEVSETGEDGLTERTEDVVLEEAFEEWEIVGLEAADQSRVDEGGVCLTGLSGEEAQSREQFLAVPLGDMVADRGEVEGGEFGSLDGQA
jgi:hypothetical protein